MDALTHDHSALATFLGLKMDGEYAMSEGQYPLAIKHFTKAQALLTKLKLQRSGHYVSILTNLALVSLKAGKLNDAERINREAISLLEEILNREDDNIGRVNLGSLWNNLGRVMQVRGRMREAEDCLRRAVAVGEGIAVHGGLVEPREVHHASFSLSTSYHNLADVLAKTGREADAILYFTRCLEIRRAILPADHEQTLQVLNNLAEVLKKIESYAEAEPVFRELVSHPGDGGLITVSHCCGLAECLISLRKEPAQAMDLLKRALAIQLSHLPPGHQDIAITRANIKVCQGLLDEEVQQPARRGEAEAVPGAGLPEELRAKMIAELIDEDKNKTSKKTGKKKT
jgi:tetratricopeptide (TPR) repeat protein